MRLYNRLSSLHEYVDCRMVGLTSRVFHGFPTTHQYKIKAIASFERLLFERYSKNDFARYIKIYGRPFRGLLSRLSAPFIPVQSFYEPLPKEKAVKKI